jgi:hypothetical protein
MNFKVGEKLSKSLTESEREKNYLTPDKKVVNASSFVKGCHPSNLLLDDDKKQWMSEVGLP